MELRSGSTVGKGILDSVHRPQFEQGVQLVLSKWTALQLAVDQRWGGDNSKDKAEDVYDELLEWFYRRKEHYVDELEPLLETVMLEDFNVQTEDGSPREVATTLIQLYEQCLQGDFSIIRSLAGRETGAGQSVGQAVDLDGAAVGMDDDDSDDDIDSDDGDGQAMEAAQTQPQGPVVDEDGFELVQRGRRRR